MSNRVYGNTQGLKANQIRRLQNIYRRSVRPQQLVSPELARALLDLSLELGRQIGVLINRRGKIEYVAVGDRVIVSDGGSNRGVVTFTPTSTRADSATMTSSTSPCCASTWSQLSARTRTACQA